eukprot:GHVT01001784.1.p1 GENE.GHVT01001784.1~~GHVT01001784.1.p1  ORF type:complete len:276 (-),score=63.44 GHVT01001784.1:438-1265(-)
MDSPPLGAIAWGRPTRGTSQPLLGRWRVDTEESSSARTPTAANARVDVYTRECISRPGGADTVESFCGGIRDGLSDEDELTAESKEQAKRWPTLEWTPTNLLVFFVFLNFFIYLERGIIPGAFQEVLAFVSSSTRCSSPDLLLGFVQSCFIVGLAVACPLVAFLAKLVRLPLVVVGGLSAWLAAVFLSATAGAVGNFELLIVARMLSGVGEASFITLAPPSIVESAGAHAGVWLGLFYAMIPFGSAVGFAFSALLAHHTGGGRAAAGVREFHSSQ